MASVGSQGTYCRIVKYGILELETEAGRRPIYSGVVVIEDKLLVIKSIERNVQLYHRHDGKPIYTCKLQSIPKCVCAISTTDVAVCQINGHILILSMESMNDIKLVNILNTGFHSCYSLVKLNSDQLVISGWKNYDENCSILCWTVVSIIDGRLDSTHDICQGYGTHMAIRGNTLYISCQTCDSITKGVYAYDICNPNAQKFMYRHQELKTPWSIMADRDYVYVSDRYSDTIHQLTDSGQLVTIHTLSSRLYGLFYDDQQRLLYTTSIGSNVITVYKMEFLNQPDPRPLEPKKRSDTSATENSSIGPWMGTVETSTATKSNVCILM